MTFAWYSDAGLTAPLTRADFTRGSTAAPVNRIVYFGSTTAGKKLQRVSSPGTDPVQVSVADAAVGPGVEVANIKLALTFAGLDSAVGGAPLSIGTTVLSGASNAVAVFVRITSALSVVGNYDDVSMRVADWVESNV